MRSAIGALVAGLLIALPQTTRADPSPVWKEVAWPFLRDAWPNGRAFECVGGPCGAKLSLYARVKVGFCDCSRGVADDEEIDRVGDVVLEGPDYHPLAAGEARALSGMDGRVRLYEINDTARRRVLSLAGGRDCNAFSAIAVSDKDILSEAADAAAAFINTAAFGRWISLKQAGQ